MTTTYTTRIRPETTYTTRVRPNYFITLITWLFTDWNPYILTDENENAIFVKDSSGYLIWFTEYTTRTRI